MRVRILSQVPVYASLLCLASLPVYAGPASERAETMGAPQQLVASIPAYLQMQTAQVQQLSRLYDGYAARRSPQLDRIVVWQDQLRQLPTTAPAQDRADRLERAVRDAQQQVTRDLLDTRTKALKTLTPVERAQLAFLAKDPRFQVRRDRYFELFLMPVEQLWQVPVASGAEADGRPSGTRSKPERHDNDRVDYGVHAGHSYGESHYEVYGSYERDSVGVRVGMGSGGASIDIGLGGVTGGRHRH